MFVDAVSERDVALLDELEALVREKRDGSGNAGSQERRWAPTHPRRPVGLASFFALGTLLAAGVAAWWRLARPTTMDVDRLLALRLLPVVGAFC